MLKILITGGSGLLGLNVAAYFCGQHRVTLGLHHTQAYLAGVNVIQLPSTTTTDDFASVISATEYDVVIHAAGFTDVDACESDPVTAMNVNAILSRNVAICCRSAGIKLVHISTDHLFDGTQAQSDENTVPSPLNQYAITKLLAEQYVAEVLPEALIIRTNFFGWGHLKKRSFSDWIIQSLQDEHVINLFDDVFFTPILIHVLAEKIDNLLALNASGIFNVCSDERISKYEFGVKISEIFGFNKNLISSTTVKSLNLKADRPRDMSLDNAKLKRVTSSTMPSLDAQLMMLKDQLDTGWADEVRNSLMES